MIQSLSAGVWTSQCISVVCVLRWHFTLVWLHEKKIKNVESAEFFFGLVYFHTAPLNVSSCFGLVTHSKRSESNIAFEQQENTRQWLSNQSAISVRLHLLRRSRSCTRLSSVARHPEESRPLRVQQFMRFDPWLTWALRRRGMPSLRITSSMISSRHMVVTLRSCDIFSNLIFIFFQAFVDLLKKNQIKIIICFEYVLCSLDR